MLFKIFMPIEKNSQYNNHIQEPDPEETLCTLAKVQRNETHTQGENFTLVR